MTVSWRKEDGSVLVYCVCERLLARVLVDGTIEVRSSCGIQSGPGRTDVTCPCGISRRVGKEWL
jgi:hypothetical protein